MRSYQVEIWAGLGFQSRAKPHCSCQSQQYNGTSAQHPSSILKPHNAVIYPISFNLTSAFVFFFNLLLSLLKGLSLSQCSFNVVFFTNKNYIAKTAPNKPNTITKLMK